jgi:3-oxoacyl-[acyl-carrier protein] reductase
MRPGNPLARRPALASQTDSLITRNDGSTCTDRVAIVTGGSRGVGREVVRKLANSGYAVVVGYARDQDAADTVVDEVLATNGTALTVRADVADELDVERLFSETIEAFGGVDVVVHTAGPTDVRGTFLFIERASCQLRDGGAIVNLYAASDAAVEAITRVLASELSGRDITVNAVAPGPIAEVAEVVAFLLSRAGHGVNGQVIRLSSSH